MHISVFRTGLGFISIDNNKVSDSVDDMYSLSVTVVCDSTKFINDTFNVRFFTNIHKHIHTYTQCTWYTHIFTISKQSGNLICTMYVPMKETLVT